MSQEEINMYKNALAREKAARKAAEEILEAKSAQLYEVNLKLEQLVKEKTSELQGVFENIVDAYVVMDLFGNVLKMNDAAVELLGYDFSKEKFSLLYIVDHSEKDNIKKGFSALLKKGTITNFEVKINTKNNIQKLVHINASVILNEHNKPIAAQGIVRDITEKKEAAENLIKSESRLSTLILNLESGIILEDENRKIVLTNKKFCDFFNIKSSPKELVDMDCQNAAQHNKVLFKDPEAFIKRIEEIDKNKTPVFGDELEMLNGRILERNYMPITIGEESKGFLWTFTDVTLKRSYSKSIEAEKQKYRNIIANMKLGLIEVDNTDKVLMINQSFSEMSGYTEEELVGKKASEIFVSDEGLDVILEESKKRKKGKSNSYELKVKTKQGDTKYWLISGAPNYNIQGEIVGSIGIHLDITDFKNLQFQKEDLLKRLEKSNENLQEYAHIVSHDLKSPLRSIYALISWLKEDNLGKLDDNSLQNFAHIERTLEKMEQLISDILEYSSLATNSNKKESVDTDALVHYVIDLLHVPEHINITIKNKLPVVEGEKTKLQQVFQNLLSNAIKFMDKPKGKIDIDIKVLTSYYQFSISDNGIGIKPQFFDKIFKVFHSLNKSKDSTGIGLSIVKKIVDLHEGKIWLESKPSLGTTFYFTLKK